MSGEPKRRGRPPGAKNKRTLEQEAGAAAAKAREAEALAKARAGHIRVLGEYEVTEEDRIKVEILAAAGLDETAIATAIMVNLAALRFNFQFELQTRGGRKNAAMVMKLYELAESGNITAIKTWLNRTDALIPAPPPADRPVDDEELPKAPKLGKKEQEQLAAENALAEPETEAAGWSDLVRH